MKCLNAVKNHGVFFFFLFSFPPMLGKQLPFVLEAKLLKKAYEIPTSSFPKLLSLHCIFFYLS